MQQVKHIDETKVKHPLRPHPRWRVESQSRKLKGVRFAPGSITEHADVSTSTSKRQPPRGLGLCRKDRRVVANGCVEQLNGVRGDEVRAALPQHHLNLQRATRIRARQELRMSRENILDFSGADFARALGLKQVVDSSAAAALVTVGDITQLNARDAAKQLARLAADPLRVCEVTRVVACNLERHRMALCSRTQRDEEFRDILYLCGKASAPFGPLRIASEQPAVLLQIGATPGGIHQDGVYILSLKAGDDVFSERLSFARTAGMQ